MTEKEKVVILIPGKEARGGITNYYLHIKDHLPDNVVFFERGARSWPKRSGPLAELVRLFTDYWRFFLLLASKNMSLMQTTTAFYSQSILRDGIFLLIGSLFSVKRIVFFRGWNNQFVHSLSGPKKVFFRSIFFRAHAIIDLSSSNIEYLKKMGYQGRLIEETTLVGSSLLKGFDPEAQVQKRIRSKKKTILFMSRLEEFKGVYILLDAFEKIKTDHAEYALVFAGDGAEEDKLRDEVARRRIQDVRFTGFISGDEKRRILEDANIFVFLSEFEGMPNAVLEAMAFALPVVTTDVGGISSVFDHGSNGTIIEERSVENVCEAILRIMNDTSSYLRYGQTNYKKAQEHFLSNVVADRVLGIFNEVLRD